MNKISYASKAIDIDKTDEKRRNLEKNTHMYFSKWYRKLLRITLKRLIKKADELYNNKNYGHSACGCFVNDTHNTLCLWHNLEAYMR